MNSYAPKTVEKNKNIAKPDAHKGALKFADQRPESLLQRKLNNLIHKGTTARRFYIAGGVVQRLAMNAAEGELAANAQRGTIVDEALSFIKGEDFSFHYDIRAEGKELTITQYDPYKEITIDAFLTIAASSYKDESGNSKSAIQEEFIGRYFHDNNVSGQVELSEEEDETGPDIKQEFNQLKACVITALLYVEGKSVLGASSVEELHQTLVKRFSTWGQYSDDNIIASLYGYMGYQKMTTAGKVQNAVTSSGKTAGMVSTGGHMIGFQKRGAKFYMRDNESVEEEATKHPKKDNMASVIWFK